MRVNLSSRQSGTVLVIALVFLVVLTLLGITGAQNTIIEERMTSNYRDRQIAQEAAEAAMITAIKRLDDVAVLQAIPWDGSDGGYDISKLPSKDPFDAAVTSKTVAGITGIDGVAWKNPSYYIERLPATRMTGSGVGIGFGEGQLMQLYRVTAKGWGKRSSMDPDEPPQVILQSTYYALE